MLNNRGQTCVLYKLSSLERPFNPSAPEERVLDIRDKRIPTVIEDMAGCRDVLAPAAYRTHALISYTLKFLP
jgi:hypothetical protein